jgi:hypothetical protein
MELASRLEPDGGMPGGSEEERVSASLDALLAFAKQGHTAKSGAFRSHVQKLIQYIEGSGWVRTLKEICSTAHDCLQQLSALDQRVRSSAAGNELAGLSKDCCRPVAELARLAEMKYSEIKEALSKAGR